MMPYKALPLILGVMLSNQATADPTYIWLSLERQLPITNDGVNAYCEKPGGITFDGGAVKPYKVNNKVLIGPYYRHRSCVNSRDYNVSDSVGVKMIIKLN